MRRFIIITLVLIGTLLLAYFMEGGNPLDLILPSPLIIVVCMPICAVLAVWSFKDWGRAWKDAFVAGNIDNAISTAAGSAKLGPSFAVDCVTPILAILFAMVARILRARVEKNAA
jgi:hypothetical protein